jgi:hypothetical protein
VKIKINLTLVFVAIVIMPATANAIDPTAFATATNVTTAGGTLYSFTVRYDDDGVIDVTSLDNSDVRVTGPNGFDAAAAFIGVNFNTDGTPRIATYSIVPPGGTWDSPDNGTYNVMMQATQVFDGLGNAVKAGKIGSFTVMAPASTPTPTPTPTSTTLGNISTRLRVETGDNVLIGGIIITGNDNKHVVLRAIGPSLGNPPFNIAGALQDPTIDLHNGTGDIIATNDNWKDTQQAEIAAFGLGPTNDLESAISITLTPGSYTAIVQGKNGGTGVGLVEAYDVDLSADSKLFNISTRGFVDINDNVMIGGFIVGGAGGSAKVVVRAIGPSLARFQIQGFLQDPTLSLFDEHGQIATNDDWKQTQQAEIEATGFQPIDDKESAILMTLPAGSYTAIVRGVNSTTGLGQIEVFNVP